MRKISFEDLFEKAREKDTFQTAKIILDFTEGLYGLMQENNISRVELAKRLGSSPAYITKVLRGDINFTVETMVRLAKAVGGAVQVHLGSREITRWVGVIDGKKDGLPKPTISFVEPDQKEPPEKRKTSKKAKPARKSKE